MPAYSKQYVPNDWLVVMVQLHAAATTRLLSGCASKSPEVTQSDEAQG